MGAPWTLCPLLSSLPPMALQVSVHAQGARAAVAALWGARGSRRGEGAPSAVLAPVQRTLSRKTTPRAQTVGGHQGAQCPKSEDTKARLKEPKPTVVVT